MFNLRVKFLISISCILLIAFGITFYKTAQFQDKLVVAYAERQARMLARQIILTRKWVADHNGLFFIKKEGVEASKFLPEPILKDDTGRILVKRNPAMVTRELSEYSNDEHFCSFRVTSLNPINPQNNPDEFEKRSLKLMESGVSEVVEVEKLESGRVLRFIIPLIVQESCLDCHAVHGYLEGDIRGGLSLTVPMTWADNAVKHNNQTLLYIAVLSIMVVGFFLYVLIDLLVVRRLLKLSKAMDTFPDKMDVPYQLASGDDEIGKLSKKFRELSERLTQSISDLEFTKEKFYQSEKMASLGRLSAGIAHEVNNPLGGMRNCVKSMKDSPGDTELSSRYLNLLDKGLSSVEKTMRQLLNFGREEPSRQSLSNINEVIKECLELIKYRMLNIELLFDFNIEGEWLVDVEALRQVVVNIGLNAVQAMPDGGELSVETYVMPESLVIAIADTGPGIPKGDFRKIFDPFFTTKEIGEGTGLGLSVTYSLVQRMSGTIVVESEEGKGCCFRITIPKLQ